MTNSTSFKQSTSSYPFRFEQYLLTWISACISTVFIVLSLVRYFRYQHQRTHLTYVYHFSLGFATVLSLISTPLHTFTEYSSSSSSSSDQQRRLLCNFDVIVFFVGSAGIGYSLAYASLERTFFIFYSQNIRLTWIRQFAPFLLIFSSCSIVITLFIVLSRCSLETSLCLVCYFTSLTFQWIWFFLQFLLPFSFMLLAVCFLVYRIEIHTQRIRSSVNRQRSKNKFQRVLIHLNIYNLYYLLAICPLNIYPFLRIPLNITSHLAEIILFNYSLISLHSYPILIYVLTKVKQPPRIKFDPVQKPAPYIIVTQPSIPSDEYQRTRL